MKSFYTKIVNFFKRFFSLNDTPHKIAFGFSIGIFWGIMPGEGVITTLLTAALFKANKAAATAGVLASNMWGTIAVLPLAAFFGSWLFHVSPEKLIRGFDETSVMGWKYLFSEVFLFDLAIPLLLGFFLVSIIISIFFYIVIYFSFLLKSSNFLNKH